MYIELIPFQSSTLIPASICYCKENEVRLTFYCVKPLNLNIMLGVDRCSFTQFENLVWVISPCWKIEKKIKWKKFHRWKNYFITHFIRIWFFSYLFTIGFENIISPSCFKCKKIQFSRFQCNPWYTIFQNLEINSNNPMVNHVLLWISSWYLT